MANTAKLNSRERIIKALNHQESDRVPIDFGGTDSTSIQLGPYKRLAKKIGCELKAPIFLHDQMQQQTEVSMEIADYFHSDARFVYLGYPKQWRNDVAYDGTAVKVPANFQPVRLPNGDLQVMNAKGQAIMKMPKDGYFFDFPYHNLADCKTAKDIEAQRDTIENFDVSAWHDMTLKDMGNKAQSIRQGTDKYIVGIFGGHVFQVGQILRGWSQFPMDLVGNAALADCLMEIAVDGQIKNFDAWYKYTGPWVDAVALADDLGIQTHTWVSPGMYRKQIKPHQKRLFQHIKKTAPELTLFYHSCGSVYEIISDFIEMGVQVLNPVQYTANKMELACLKQEFGKDLAFWGGGCDSQKILPYGTPQEVADEVKKNIDIMAPGGGFVFGSVHNITEGVPTDNIVAMFETAYQCGAY